MNGTILVEEHIVLLRQKDTMSDIKPLLHEIMNALTIARGLTENLEVAPEELKMEYIEKAIKAMDRIETATLEIRTIVNQK